MRRIRRQRQFHERAAWRLMHSVGAEVVFHVAGALGGVRIDVAFEFIEDLFVRLTERVGEHIQPAAMSHADDRFLYAVGGRFSEEEIEHRDDALGPFERESLVADVLRMQKFFECFCIIEFHQNAPLRGEIEGLFVT